MVLDGKSSQEYPVYAGVPQGPIPGPTLFLLYINDIPDDVICNIAIYDDSTLYSNCDQSSGLWQQLELASEVESDLRDTVDFFLKKKKTLRPLFMVGIQLPQGYSHFEEAVYFLPFSSQKFLVLILSTSEG